MVTAKSLLIEKLRESGAHGLYWKSNYGEICTCTLEKLGHNCGSDIGGCVAAVRNRSKKLVPMELEQSIPSA
jgi:hypothetical protein